MRYLLLLLVVLPLRAEVDPRRFLDSVRIVAQTDHLALGPFDMMRATWRDRTSRPYSEARREATARPVAEAHLRWLRAGLLRAGVEPSVHNLAACWRLGLEGGKRAIRRGRYPWYADSVRNIYYNP